MNNKKYNPEDYKDVEFITLGDGPVRIQFAKPANLSVGDFWYFAGKLAHMESELGLIKNCPNNSILESGPCDITSQGRACGRVPPKKK
jgi:hypothetical protein